MNIKKFMKKIVLILLFAFSFSACEKDDICDATTTTTPDLVIDFYNILNPTQKKSFASLKIIENGNENAKAIVFGNVNQVIVPLKLDKNTTSFKFILNGNDTNLTDDETDIVIVNYSRSNTFVSRACGYKTTFLLNDTAGFVRNDEVTPALNYWIKNFEILNKNIDNKNEIHVKIFF